MKIYRILLQIIVITIISTTVFMIDPETSYACSCVKEPTVQEEMQNKTAVFSGKVTGIRESRKWFSSSADPIEVTFEVEQVWKGEVRKKQTIYTAMSSASCGNDFITGAEYMVYAHRNSDSGKLETNICSRTRPISQATDDLITLGAGIQPPDHPDSTGTKVNFTQWIGYSILVLAVMVIVVFGVKAMRKRK